MLTQAHTHSSVHNKQPFLNNEIIFFLNIQNSAEHVVPACNPNIQEAARTPTLQASLVSNRLKIKPTKAFDVLFLFW